MKLYLLRNYCNYFNRQVKYRETLEQYLEGRTENEDYFIVDSTNFNPNDGITTEHVIGSGHVPFNMDWSPDYLLCVDDKQPIIRSRWYVLDFPRIMANQYNAVLKRDSICDWYAPLLSAPTYIKKAMLPKNSPLIVNSEGMNLNQRKVAEYLLRDRSKVPWIVCYIAHDINGTVDVATGLPPNIPNIDENVDPEARYIRELFIRDGQFNTTFNAVEITDLNMKLEISYDIQYTIALSNFETRKSLTVSIGQDNVEQASSFGELLYLYFVNRGYAGANIPDSDKEGFKQLSRNLALDYRNFYNFILSNTNYGITRSERLDGSVYRPTNGKIWKYGQSYYEMVRNVEEKSVNIILPVRSGQYLYNKLNEYVRSSPTSRDRGFRLFNVKIVTYTYELRVKAGLTASINLQANRIHPDEVPYDIIAFPYDKIRVKQWNKDIDDVASLATARSIAVKFTQAGCYDVQILPFCPVLDQYIDENGDIDLGSAVEGAEYAIVKKDNTNFTIGFYCHSAYQSLSGNNAIKKLFANNQEYDVSEICHISEDGRKVDNECDMWRLCAPNFTAQFEFKLTKTIDIEYDTPLDHFDVDITYRPYQPYIRVAPQFDFLYVTNYNDARGLICTSGFSITLVDDKWQTYELNNKNYQEMFNREIKSMETNRKIAREKEQWDMGWEIADLMKGQFNDAPIQGFSGFMSGGPIGGIVSSVKAGVNSLYAGAKNISSAAMGMNWAERAYKEQRDFKLDMFNMSLDNIKALPASITQSSSISYNFKFFPVLEKYTCTDEERELVKNKIKWNGMTVGLISTVSEYISETEERYIQGEIIRLEGLDDDSHVANDIYQELNKGLFFVPYIPQNKEEVRNEK